MYSHKLGCINKYFLVTQFDLWFRLPTGSWELVETKCGWEGWLTADYTLSYLVWQSASVSFSWEVSHMYIFLHSETLECQEKFSLTPLNIHQAQGGSREVRHILNLHFVPITFLFRWPCERYFIILLFCIRREGEHLSKCHA